MSTPRDFLNVWEPWIQAGMSASRQVLGDRWQQAFLTAPIWRYWLGAELCGSPVVGAFMPSLDGIGRYFPITLLISGESGSIPPPELDPQDQWFATAEEFLLSILHAETTFEATMAALERLPMPSAQSLPVLAGPTVATKNSRIARATDRPLPEILGSIRVTDHTRTYGSATFWWTLGGEGFEPIVISSQRMPDPHLFTEMLTGHFAFGFE